ncbi:MAG TPA: ABC transporter substrate-binding protein [Candidatus Dormibacteraeota bacterium]|nr:ABC transporter substrate-binding protein [Candidatus Dormibacteraeota bacterium]
MVERSRTGLAACCAAIVLLGSCSPAGTATTTHILVVDKSFDLHAADPHRELDVTGALISRALYSTLLTFDGGDEATPVQSVARSYSSSEDARTYTFNLRRDITFSDGTALTSADVVYSINRIINLKGAPSALLAGVSASAPDTSTVVLKSSEPNPSLPLLLANPAIAIVNSRLVTSHGGSSAAGADTTDKAGDFLNTASAGSGPYMLKSFSTFSDVELVANPRYWGRQPFYRRVVIRNMDSRTQLAYIASATDEIALDLSPEQAGTLTGKPSVRINSFTSPDVVFLFANENPLVSAVTANKHFQNAVRSAVDYGALIQLMGAGAIQAAGVIPGRVLGALPAWAAQRQDAGTARAELAASGVTNPTVNLAYASDIEVSGLPVSALASMVKAELEAAGIKVNLSPAKGPAAMADFTAGHEQMGLWLWPGSSPDPNTYLAFLPGRQLGLRAGWPGAADPSLESLGMQASTTPDPATRAQLFQALQGQLNSDGPFFPLLQPGRMIVASNGIAGIAFNPSWTIDLSAVGD